MGYYDLDDILTDSTELPCTFNHTIQGIGYLQNNPTPANSIKKDTKLLLPLWLARMLAMVGTNDISFLDIHPPYSFSNTVINAMLSDPVHLDLHSLNDHFFNLVVIWCNLFNDTQLAEICYDSLLKRSIEINLFSNNIILDTLSNNNDYNHFWNSLDQYEKNLFLKARNSYSLTKKWFES